MHKLIAARFALPTIVIAALITLAFVAFILLTAHHGGAAWTVPGP